MSYQRHFKLTDDLIVHLDQVLLKPVDPFLESRYTGFLAVSAVTVFELTVKSIFLDFADSKHVILKNFCSEFFSRINGRIGMDSITKEYLQKFGQKYLKRFKTRIDRIDREYLRSRRMSVKNSYSNLITWRNAFAHEGNLPQQATYAEVKEAYQAGKLVMDCLAGCMKR